MGNTYYKQLCGCEIIVVLDCNGYEHVEITYCSNHYAADEMYEALKDAPYPPDAGADEYYIVDVWLPKYTKWRRGINKALALADGDGGE